MQALPLVSIVINCYNGEEFLKNAIDSIYAQSYQHWEIIFWDNASTDQSPNIALSYDEKLRYFKSETTTPLYEARSLAVKKAKGDFVGFLDCDDWWNPDKLEKQMPLFDDLNIGFVYGNYWMENETKRTKTIVSQKLQSSGMILDDLLKHYTVGILTLIIRRSAYDQLDYGFDKRFNIIGDFDLVIRLAAEWKSDYVDKPIAHYRSHSNNLSTNNPTSSFEELEEWYKTILKHSIISKSKALYNIPIIINYVRAMFYMKNNKKIDGFNLLLKIPLFRKEKIKATFAFILPKFLLNFLTQ